MPFSRINGPRAPLIDTAHHAETRLCISLPFHVSFIANIARKRPELYRDKTMVTLWHLFAPTKVEQTLH
jgi:hypothetical protein